MSRDDEKSSDEPVFIKINTTFSGKIAKFIANQQREWECSAPEVIRRILFRHVAEHPVFLKKDLVEVIETLVSNPIIREGHGLVDVDTFVSWAIQKGIELMRNEAGTLRQASVQATLKPLEKEVAKHLLILSRNHNYYGGVTVDQLEKVTKIEKEVIFLILREFVRNGWVLERKEEDVSFFLPKE